MAPPLCREVGEERMLLLSPAAKVARAGRGVCGRGWQVTRSPQVTHPRWLAGAAREPGRLQLGRDASPRASPTTWPPALG